MGGYRQWYAAKVFYNKVNPIVNSLMNKGFETYIPTFMEETYGPDGLKYVRKPLINSLLFICSSSEGIRKIGKEFSEELRIYGDGPTFQPTAIPDKEMEIFRIVTSAQDKGLKYLGADLPEYHTGQRVRVTDGVFKGAEGHIKRIFNDRRLIVTVEGIAAVATSFIHPSFLEKI